MRRHTSCAGAVCMVSPSSGLSFVGLWDIHGLTTLRFPEFRRVSVRVESEGVKGKETSIDEVCAGIDADMYSGGNRFKSLGLFKTQN